MKKVGFFIAGLNFMANTNNTSETYWQKMNYEFFYANTNQPKFNMVWISSIKNITF